MNQALLILLTFLACSHIQAQERFYNFVEGWRNSYSAETDTTYVLFGNSSSQGFGIHEHRVNIINHEGDSVTSLTYKVDSLEITGSYCNSSVATLINNEVILTGYSGNLSEDRYFGTLFSYSLDGQGQEFAFFDEDQVNYPETIISSNDSTLLIGALVSDFSAFRRMFIYNTDLDGNERWAFTNFCGSFCDSRPEQILPLSDGNIAVLFYEYDGSFPSFEETLRTCLVKLNSEGEEIWRRYPGDWEGNHINPGGIVEIEEEILLSYTNPYFYNDIDQWDFNDSGSVHLVRYNLEGEIISEIDYMQQMYNNLDSARVEYDVNQMQLLDDGNILISGSTGPGGLLMKIDPDGTLLWFREQLKYPLEVEGGFTQEMNLCHILPTSDGGFLGTGVFNSTPSDWNPGFINTAIALKVDEYGCLEPGCHLVSVPEFSRNSSLKVLPNPAQTLVKIRGDFRNQELFVEVFDHTGSRVLGLNLNSRYEFDVSGLSNGIYIITASTFETIHFGQLVISK